MSPTIRNQVKLATVAAVAALLLGGVALAGNPHLVKSDANINDDGALEGSWKEAQAVPRAIQPRDEAVHAPPPSAPQPSGEAVAVPRATQPRDEAVHAPPPSAPQPSGEAVAVRRATQPRDEAVHAAPPSAPQ
jgi:hypothetical protein